MNELRMYVEHLFQGKVLTPENIELKEEIYGNLMARYEDLIAGGADESEALRRTKESFTSIDGVLSDASSGKAAESAPAASGATHGSNREADGAASTLGDAPTRVQAASDGLSTASGVKAGPRPPEGAQGAAAVPQEQETPRERRKVWPWACGGCLVLAVVIVVFVVLMGAWGWLGAIFNSGVNVSDGDKNVSIGADGLHVQDGDRSVDISLDKGLSVRDDDTGIVVSSDGVVRIDGEVGDELLNAVVNSSYTDVQPYIDTQVTDAGSIQGLAKALPMGEWFTNLDTTLGANILAFDYRLVPESYDGDSIEAALAYNASVLFCAIPAVDELRVTVTESDEAWDEEYYVFTRSDAERLYGMPLNGDLVNEAGWDRLKGEKLYLHDFAEHMVEMAERDNR